jgi:hypothetical protein
MPSNFTTLVTEYSKQAFVFEADSLTAKYTLLRMLSKSSLDLGQALLDYHSLLLFTITHAESEALYQLAEKELKRLAAFLKKGKNASHPLFTDSGLPFTTLNTRFSPEVFTEMKDRKDVEIQLDVLGTESVDLNAFLKITLPPILKDETTAGLDNDSLMDVLGIAPTKKFEFLLSEIVSTKASPLAKDFLWQALNPFFLIRGKGVTFSKSFNRIETKSIFYTQHLTKQFDHMALLNQPIESAVKLTPNQAKELVTVIQNTMTLSMREIDPITYMDKRSLKWYPLSNGLSMAIFGMLPERQLTLHSYVGYMLFKNGYPISYGGAWVFGKSALFALNIFEEFRGGESKFVMTQILRVYKQVFGITYFEVEPYQFGNEDALKSGAFWFYYKFGFRPLESAVAKLAEAEVVKMKKNTTYRSSIQKLSQLATGNIALRLDKEAFVHRNDIINPILNLITKRYKGNHKLAIQDAKTYFETKWPERLKLDAKDEVVFEEIALWAYALKIKDNDKLRIMAQMIKAKTRDYVLYNQLILQLT